MDPNWTPTQGGAATGPSSGAGADPNANPDWRSQLQQDARQRIVNKIMDTLKRHLPVPVPEGLSVVQKIAVRFEEKIYSTATSQPDYLRKISLKMLSMETKTQPGSFPNQNRIDQGVGIASQQPGPNPGQSLAMPQAMNQPPGARQQQQPPLLQGSPNMPTSVPGGHSGGTIPPMSGPSMSNSNPMSGPGGPSGPGRPTGSLQTDMYQRRQQPQQLQSQNQMLLQQQQLVMRHKLQQQQQHNLLQQTQTQMSSALTAGSGMMSAAPTGGMQQSQLNSVQQQQVSNRLPLMRQQQQQPQAPMQNSTIPMQQTNNVTDLQQQRLQMQQNQMQQSQMQQNQMQQNQMQQNQMQQSQMQQSQLQQNQLQPNQMLNQQMVLGQQQNHLLGSGGAGNMTNMQSQIQMQRQAGLLQQQQPQQQQHLLSQFQSQQQQLPQQQLQTQQQQPNIMQQREMQMQQQRMQGSPALLQAQNGNAIDPQRQQQQQFMQQQRVLQDVASSPASMDSTAQTGHSGDLHEEMYQRLKYLKDTYFTDLREIHQKLAVKLSQLDNMVLPNARGGEQIEKMKNFKMVLERMMTVLQLPKSSMHLSMKDKLSLYEKQILNILHNHKKGPQQQSQAGVPSDQQHFAPLQQQQQQQQQQQTQQMDNHPNQLQQFIAHSNNMGMPNAMQQGMQNALQSDKLQASSTGFGSLQHKNVLNMKLFFLTFLGLSMFCFFFYEYFVMMFCDEQ